MTLFEWLNRGIGRMQWYDITLVKIGVIAFTLFALVAWPTLQAVLLDVEWYWYLIVMVAAMLAPLRKLLTT